MKLSDRLQAIEPDQTPSSPGNGQVGETIPSSDPLAEFKGMAKQALYGKLESQAFGSALGEGELKATVIKELERLIADTDIPLSAAERERIAEEISEDILGYGPIQRFLDDREVTEIMVNSTNPIFVERAGKISRTTSRFSSEEHLRQVIERIVASVGRRVDEASPMVDARLPDGSRVNAIIPPWQSMDRP